MTFLYDSQYKLYEKVTKNGLFGGESAIPGSIIGGAIGSIGGSMGGSWLGTVALVSLNIIIYDIF